MLGKPYLKHDRMWEYHLSDGSLAFVSFDKEHRVTSWARYGLPGLRSGLVPVDADTYDRLERGMSKRSVRTLLGEPARQEDNRWFYFAPNHRLLELGFNDADRLTRKALYRVVEPAPEGEEAPAQEPAQPGPSGPEEPGAPAP